MVISPPLKDITQLIFIMRNFDYFIDECCMHEGTTTTASIMGMYRIWAQETSKDTFHALKKYLDGRFKKIKIQHDNKGVLEGGYSGVSIIYNPPFISDAPSVVEHFIFDECVFRPDYKVLQASLVMKFKEWSDQNGTAPADVNALRKYLKSLTCICKGPLFVNGENGMGYYGIALIGEQDTERTLSVYAKQVQKKDTNGTVLKQWPTIAKAALEEGYSHSKLSRMIKSGKASPEGWSYICS